MKWTTGNIKKFAAAIEGSSVEQLKAFVEDFGDGRIPPCSPSTSRFYSADRVVDACMENPIDAAEKLRFFIDEGLGKPYRFSFGIFVKSDGRGNLLNTPEELEAIKDVFRLFCAKGWKIGGVGKRDLAVAVRAYHDDLEFLASLSHMGFEFTAAKELGYDIVDLLLRESSMDTLDFLVERGLRLTDWGDCSIASTWTEDVADYMLRKGQKVLLENFDPDCSFEAYRYAVEKAGMKYEDLRLLWERAVNGGRLDIGEYLLSRGIAVCSERIDIRTNDIEAIDWALGKGFSLGVDIDSCERDALLYAARHGAEPVGSLEINVKTHEAAPAWAGGDLFEGMRAVCELFDAELIKAFLEAGFAEGADATSAVEAANEELLDLYAAYGVATTVKKVSNGAAFVKKGAAKIPEGVEEIAHDAFKDVEFKTLELPSTLKTIGERAFERGWRGCEVEEITVPKSVASLGYGAFKGFGKIRVYDNLDADAAPAHEKVDDCNGHANGSVGWVGVSPAVGFVHCAANAGRADHEITVLSSETGEVKFRVEMPIGSATRDVYCTLVSAWGKNAEFDFSVYKDIFSRLPGKASKLKTAINRLMWPIDLDEDDRAVYEKYVVRYAKDAASHFAASGEFEGIELLASIGAIKKTNVDDMISAAHDADRADMAAFLESYKANILSSKKARKA